MKKYNSFVTAKSAPLLFQQSKSGEFKQCSRNNYISSPGSLTNV